MLSKSASSDTYCPTRANKIDHATMMRGKKESKMSDFWGAAPRVTSTSKFRFYLEFRFSSIQVSYSGCHHMMHHDDFGIFRPEIQILKKFFEKTNILNAERG